MQWVIETAAIILMKRRCRLTFETQAEMQEAWRVLGNRILAEFVEFAFSDRKQLESVARVFEALCVAKQTSNFRDDAYWLAFFDEAARAAFWWPTPSELKAWEARWFSTPLEQRATDPTLANPWGFGSLIEAFENGEYELLGCREVEPGIARLEFAAYAYPYGGTGCMHALVEAFGCRVVREDA